MARATILLADNDPDFLATRGEFLKQEGYELVTAQSTAAARRELGEGQINLAIIDIRLVNDDDEKDVSGLTLAQVPAYRSIRKIILTGFPSTDAAREALRLDLGGSPPALDFIAKKEGPEAMLIAVQRVLAVSHRQPRPLLVFVLLLGAVLAGVIGIVYGDPRWLIGTAAFGILFSIFTWRLAVE